MSASTAENKMVFLCVCIYVYMNLIIGKGQIAQKDHTGEKIGLRAKVRVNISI